GDSSLLACALVVLVYRVGLGQAQLRGAQQGRLQLQNALNNSSERTAHRTAATRSLVVLNMQDDIGSSAGSPSNQARDTQSAGAISRRRMLATSAGALVGASMIGAGKAATETDIGDKTP